MTFADADEHVREISAESVRTSAPATLRVALAATDGRVVHEATLALPRDRVIPLKSVVPAGSTASRLSLELSSPGAVHAWLTDVRVQGQTPQLERYIKRRLRFPAVPPIPDEPR